MNIAGDLIHAGMNSPNTDNIRIHIIMKTQEFQAGGNEQGWLIKIDGESGKKWMYDEECDHTEQNLFL